ncbi:MAG: phage portal protein [Bilifractor sp.]
MIPSKSIEQAEHIETPLSTEMQSALQTWYEMYLDQSPWLESDDAVKSMNLAAFISSEIARQVTLEMKWNITGKSKDGSTTTESGEDVMNPRAQYLKDEFEKLVRNLRIKLEQGCAAGGMTILPYPNLQDGHIYFSYTMDWELFPVAFGLDGSLTDVIFQDQFVDGKTYYTRLERHKLVGQDVQITQQAYKSNNENYLGTPIELSEVDRWKGLQKEVTIKGTDGQLFGWYRVASSNTVDADSPMGASVFAKAVPTIEQADKQYSRLLWEFEGSELAIDVDPTALRPRQVRDNSGNVRMEMPKLNQRLFRQVDIDKGDRDLYEVFSPPIRDQNLLNGLNQLLIRVEDLTGLSRGTLSDANDLARTATELKIMKQRSYATVNDNQAALERCLKDVIRAMDKYATLYHLAPEGDYDVSFDWDDSILTDTDSQANEWFTMLNANIVSKAEFREWYFGETKAQAKAAVDAVTQETVDGMSTMQQNIRLPGADDESQNAAGSGRGGAGPPSQAGEE